MELLQSDSTVSTIAPLSYDFFFKNLEYNLSKGKGFSVFEADEIAITSFADQCARNGCSPSTVRLSSLSDSTPEVPTPSGFIVIIQDLPFEDFLQRAGLIADRLIFPLWFRQASICFFSVLGRGAYDNLPLGGDELHKNYGMVVNSLLCEQVIVLLERVNAQFSSPDFTHLPSHKAIYTPIEEKLLSVLNTHKLSYQSQVRIGRHIVDFLVTLEDGNKKVIVECDSKAYHDPDKDRERDKVLAREGYPICHFSGAEILTNAEACIKDIQKAAESGIVTPYSLDDDLDSSQMAAAVSIAGPIRVLAPAGSGKTKTLINRILNLLNHGIPPEKILALAFNKKARDEMQERLERKGIHGIQVRTFHSLGYEIVRESLGWTFAGSAHKNISRDLMRSAIRQHTELPPLRNKDPLDAFLDGLRKAKMDLLSLPTLTVEYGERVYPFEPIFYSYLKAQLDQSYLDFDDMIYLALRVLLEDSSLRRVYQSQFEFVLVDEFQDLNQAQLLLLQILSLPENNIFAVGDDDQMIYGFRGAEVRHIIEFDKRFPVATSHVLNTNYRSSRMIVRHSGWLVDQNTERVKKNVQPRPGAQVGSFEISGHTSVFEQAEYAARWLVEHKSRNNLRWSDYAFLYRYNAYQFPIAIVLDALNVPHTPLSGQNLFQTQVGRDIYSYLQIILSPSEASCSDFERVLKRPNKYFTNQLIARARDWNSFQHLPQVPNLRDWEREKLDGFIRRIETFSKKARDPNISAVEFLQAFKIDFGLSGFYRDQSRMTDDLDQANDENLLEVIEALSENFTLLPDFHQSICKFIDDEEIDSKPHANGDEVSRDEVYLGTIHRAKGKEFRNVVYFNLSKTGKVSEKFREEEERRVAYVGATRPKDSLLITFPSAKPSIFLSEICLNPKFKGITDDYLERWSNSTRLRLRKEKARQKQMERYREKLVARFRELTDGHTVSEPTFLLRASWLILNWHIQKIHEKIENLDRKIKDHTESVIEPLLVELSDLEEESKLRKVIKPHAP